jgi:hypothetical protein
MKSSQFDFSNYLRPAAHLSRRLRAALINSNDEKVRALISGLPTFGTPEDSGTPMASLSVAFVGQYNSGKSTMIRALTDIDDIPIDADVCTDKVTAYDWNGIKILDTPGIHAGYVDHDEVTYAAIEKVDLLVFAITNELFDDIIGNHFRELCIARDRASETLLVVNKMSQDSGTPEIKLPDIARVTSPLTPEDYRTTFIDALSYLEALEETDGEDRADLLELANFESFVEALNGFVSEKGYLGRLTTPLFEVRAIAQQAEALLSVDLPEERAAIELLSRKRGVLLGSRSRLQGVMSGLVGAAAADLVTLGDTVAEAVEPGSKEEDVRTRHEQAQEEARERCEQLERDAQAAVEDEIEELRRQLIALQNGVFAQELKGYLSDEIGGPRQVGESDSHASEVRWNGSANAPGEWTTRVNRVADVADGLGKFAAKWATGPLAETAKMGSATASRGSSAHQAVYNVGKFFGVKFKPWGAVNVARTIGNVGRFIAAAGGVLAVVAQVLEDKQLDEYRLQLREARDGIRSAYRDSVHEIEAAFWTRFGDFSRDFYGSELAAVEELITGLVDQRSDRGGAATEFSSIATGATQIIQGLQEIERPSHGLTRAPALGLTL